LWTLIGKLLLVVARTLHVDSRLQRRQTDSTLRLSDPPSRVFCFEWVFVRTLYCLLNAPPLLLLLLLLLPPLYRGIVRL